jgi:hypothetical protein
MNCVTDLKPTKFEVGDIIAAYGEKLANPKSTVADMREIIGRLQELARHL